MQWLPTFCLIELECLIIIIACRFLNVLFNTKEDIVTIWLFLISLQDTMKSNLHLCFYQLFGKNWNHLLINYAVAVYLTPLCMFALTVVSHVTTDWNWWETEVCFMQLPWLSVYCYNIPHTVRSASHHFIIYTPDIMQFLTMAEDTDKTCALIKVTSKTMTVFLLLTHTRTHSPNMSVGLLCVTLSVSTVFHYF